MEPIWQVRLMLAAAGSSVNRFDSDRVEAFRNGDDVIAIGNVEGGIIELQGQPSGGGVEGHLGRPAESAGDTLIGEEINGENIAAGDRLVEDAMPQFSLINPNSLLKALSPRCNFAGPEFAEPSG